MTMKTILLLTLLVSSAYGAQIYGPLIGAKLEPILSDPTGAGATLGRIYLNSTDFKPKFYNGTAWLTFEDTGNKSTDVTLGGGSPSNTLYSSQAAVKSYVDTAISSIPTPTPVPTATPTPTPGPTETPTPTPTPIPWGDLTAGTGLSIGGTGTGALKGAGASVSVASGYYLPVTQDQTNWNALLTPTITPTPGLRQRRLQHRFRSLLTMICLVWMVGQLVNTITLQVQNTRR